MKIFFTILFLSALHFAGAQTAGVHAAKAGADTLKEGVYRPPLQANTPDLTSLEIHVTELDPGKAPHPPHTHADMEELILVKEGKLKVTIKDKIRVLGPGGVALAFPGDEHGVENAGDTKAIYTIIKYQSRYGLAGGPVAADKGSYMVDWKDLVAEKTDRGERRNLFDRPGALFRKLELHATTLNAGQVSHAPHVHRQEEIILLRSGDVQMQIGDNFYKAGPGDLIFLASGVKHALKNMGTGPCEYFALQWE